MRRALVILGLALLAAAATVPALEALAPCPEQCSDEAPGSRCDTDQCCSCCVHARLAKADRLPAADPLSSSSHVAVPSAGPPAAADPREILHIPKPIPA